ncbi:MAG: acetyl/propionyl/methylcrotonyl-CoA carboxylase subunit alpha [Pseudomonadota bacterium]|nr:acetyl/propionyl/methylcrotonyl-CoA carboxylase subunit alpha [Pseudomonadota bacterium]
MFKKILIANRGEISLRIMQTAKRMGISTVAVYSDVDEHSPHVSMADEAIFIGSASATNSYLSIERILDAAKKTNADCIHPGYGFLSENSNFSDEVRRAGLTFIGPPSQAIRDMGSKDNAKSIMEKAGVPVLPGFSCVNKQGSEIETAANTLGYPILLKAANGGGGKGMRIVSKAGELAEALNAASREAAASFGNDRLIVEKCIDQPRHIEVQIFGDSHGNYIHLFERDCSVQRRHQKIIEEAPAPNISDSLREEITGAAVKAAQAIKYENAGTIEFLVDKDDNFYFMEMNTRLQVEHAVTELITGVDLVEWQITVANGGKIPMKQDEIQREGHAIEARLYAEDPEKNFLPSPGVLRHLAFPTATPSLRIDTGVLENQRITSHYDPMLAKVISWGGDRNTARHGLTKALTDTEIAGITVNRDFLINILNNERFIKSKLDTGIIDRLNPNEFRNSASIRIEALTLSGLYLKAAIKRKVMAEVKKSGDPNSPWFKTDSWRLNGASHQEFILRNGSTEIHLQIIGNSDTFLFKYKNQTWTVTEAKKDNGLWNATINGISMSGRVVELSDRSFVIFQGGYTLELSKLDIIGKEYEVDNSPCEFTAPMPGKVVSIKVSENDRVKAGDTLIILEAMKMEHSIKAPVDGVVTKVFYTIGDQVDEGKELLSFQKA